MQFIDWLLMITDLYSIVFTKHSIVFIITTGLKLKSVFYHPKITFTNLQITKYLCPLSI